MQTGTYILLLHLSADAELDIPGLGQTTLPAGFYAYADSAFGVFSLPERIKTHLAAPTRPREHIDFLRQAATVTEVWMALGDEPHEHEWVSLLLAIPGSISITDGFGVSDCTCESHLVYFDVRPELDDFQIGARKLFSTESIIRAKTNYADESL